MRTMKWVMLLGVSLPGLAHAQSTDSVPQPPERVQIDENGVDLLTGNLTVDMAPIWIGGTGKDGFSYQRHWVNNSWISDYDIIAENSANVGTPNWININIGGTSYRFDLVNGAYVSREGRGSTLTIPADGYLFTNENGDKYKFSVLYRHAINTQLPITITKADGEVLTFEYETVRYYKPTFPPTIPPKSSQIASLKRTSKVTSSRGYTLTYSYMSDDLPRPYDLPVGTGGIRNVSKVTLSNTVTGGVVAVSYVENVDGASDQFGSIVETRPDGTQKTYTTKYVQNFSDPLQSKKLVSVSGAPSQAAQIAYGADNRVSSITSRGITTNYSWSVNGGTLSGNATSPAGTRHVVIDAVKGVLTSDTDQIGRTRSYLYDDKGRITRLTLPEGGSTGGYLSYSYDGRGNVTQVTQVAKAGSATTNVTILAGYPATCSNPVHCNKPDWARDAKGNQTDFTYDPTHGGLVTATAPALPNGVRPQNRYSYVQQGGIWVLSSTSSCRTAQSCAGTSDEVRTSFTYDANLLPVTQTTAAGDNSLTSTTTIAHDAIGNVISTDGPLAGSEDTTYYRYDTERRQIGEISPDPDGAGPLKRKARRLLYMTDGQVMTEATGTVADPSDAAWNNYVEAYHRWSQYDAAGRVNRQTLWSNGVDYAVADFVYDAVGRLSCRIDYMDPVQWGPQASSCAPLQTNGPNGPDRVTKYDYDAASQQTQVTSGYGTADAAAEVMTTYTADGQVATVADGKGNLTTYEYDGLDRLVKTRYPSPSATGTSSTTDYEQLTLDANGNVTSRRLRDGTSIGYGYDTLNRMVSKTRPGGEPGGSFSYDLLGQPQTMTQDTTLVYAWDALGRLISEQQPFGTVAYQYDAAGHRTRMTWPDGFYVTYSYDAAGQLTAIKENGTADLAKFAYDDLGRRTSLTRGNGVVTRYDSYDAVSRLTSLTNDLLGTARDQTVTFGYNPAGQIKNRTASNDAYTWTGAVNVDRSYTVNGLNQYTAAGGVSFGYDPRGNLTSSGASTYAYTSENQLKAASGGTTLYYDPQGRLVEYDTTVSRRFVYDGSQMAAEVANPSGAIQRRYVFGPGSDEVLVEYDGSGNKSWLVADERGSIVAKTDASGAATAVASYDEYGIPAGDDVGRFGYTGQAFLPEIGLNYYKARMYSPTLGRFMQTDPIGYEDGLNWYNYVGSDPINGTDPTGNIAGADDIVVTAILSKGLPVVAQAAIGIVSGIGAFFSGIFGGSSPPQIKTQTNQQSPQNNRTKICAGRARGLAGNTRLYGKMGAFAVVRPNTAAIIPYQFGGSRKADLRPYVSSISGRLTGTVGGRTVTSEFNGITDVIDGTSPIPGMGVRDALMRLNPGQLIVEVPGGADVGSNASVVLNNYPASLPCPTGTSAQ